MHHAFGTNLTLSKHLRIKTSLTGTSAGRDFGRTQKIFANLQGKKQKDNAVKILIKYV
jgi:hypothetical protein